MKKTYIEVIAKHKIDGSIIPLSIEWEDGRIFDITKVIEVKQAPSAAGGIGMRYTCLISGRKVYLFLEKVVSPARWFVEGK